MNLVRCAVTNEVKLNLIEMVTFFGEEDKVYKLSVFS